MPRVDLTIQKITKSGPVDLEALEQTPDETDSAMFANDGNTFLYVRNTGLGDHVLTFQTPQTVAGLAVADHTVTVAAGKTALLGPFPTDTFNVQSGPDVGKVYVDVDGTRTEVKLVALRP